MASKKAAKKATKSTGTRKATRTRAAKARGVQAAAQGTEDHLKRLVDAARRTFDVLRDIEDEVPEDKKDNYFRERAAAREAFELAEIAVFQNLVEQQKAQLPVVTASMSKLADDVEAAANAISVLNLVSAGVGVFASVGTLFA